MVIHLVSSFLEPFAFVVTVFAIRPILAKSLISLIFFAVCPNMCITICSPLPLSLGLESVIPRASNSSIALSPLYCSVISWHFLSISENLVIGVDRFFLSSMPSHSWTKAFANELLNLNLGGLGYLGAVSSTKSSSFSFEDKLG